jgi:hypothetical protein
LQQAFWDGGHSGTWREQFRLLQGKELIKVYGKGEGAEGVLFNLRVEFIRYSAAIGRRHAGIDSDARRSMMIQGFGRNHFVADRAPWDVITDDLPQFPERRT